jgi:hypothetical protein
VIPEERKIVIMATQTVLEPEERISSVHLDGLVSYNFINFIGFLNMMCLLNCHDEREHSPYSCFPSVLWLVCEKSITFCTERRY